MHDDQAAIGEYLVRRAAGRLTVWVQNPVRPFSQGCPADWLEAYPIAAVGPGGDELTIDVASSATEDADNVLVISSGLHGVEGFFGSAVQTMVLERWASSASPPVRCVLLHALNPYGFAWIRHPEENNEDLKELGASGTG